MVLKPDDLSGGATMAPPEKSTPNVAELKPEAPPA
jgi:hypothetical protein